MGEQGKTRIGPNGPDDPDFFMRAVAQARDEGGHLTITRGGIVIGFIDVNAPIHPADADKVDIISDSVIAGAEVTGSAAVGFGDVIVGNFEAHSLADLVRKAIENDPERQAMLANALDNIDTAVPAANLFTDQPPETI